MATIKAPTREEFCAVVTSRGKGQHIDGYWSGSAFRDHPVGVFREQLLFTNKWNVNNYCSVQVATDRNAKLVLGCQDSCARGNPYPTVTSGDLVTVYRDGEWIADGPWCEKVVRILDDLKRERAEFIEKRKAEAKAESDAARRAAAERLDAARAALGA